MSNNLHRVQNIFISDGTAFPANDAATSSVTAGKIGIYGQDMLALNPAGGDTITTQPFIYLLEGKTDSNSVNYLKRSFRIDGANVTKYEGQSYAPDQPNVWSIGYSRKTATGSIEVNNSTTYKAVIRFKNDKNLYSARPEVLTITFDSVATATKLSIATQISNAINNSAFKGQISAIVVGNGTGVYGVTGATEYGVEIWAKDINQFIGTNYTPNNVYFSVHVDDSTGFGDTTTCTQIQANSYGEGTYTSIYNKENFEYQYEGLSNRRLWPAQTPKFGAVSTGFLSGNVAAAATSATGNVSAVAVGDDTLTFATSTAGFRGGEIITVNGVEYEILYVLSSTVVRIKGLATAVYAGGAAVKVKYFYDTIVITFADNKFTSGADVQSVAQKAVYIATPAIDAGAADPFDTTGDSADTSTEGLSLLSKLNTWLASTPAAPATLTFA